MNIKKMLWMVLGATAIAFTNGCAIESDTHTRISLCDSWGRHREHCEPPPVIVLENPAQQQVPQQAPAPPPGPMVSPVPPPTTYIAPPAVIQSPPVSYYYAQPQVQNTGPVYLAEPAVSVSGGYGYRWDWGSRRYHYYYRDDRRGHDYSREHRR